MRKLVAGLLLIVVGCSQPSRTSERSVDAAPEGRSTHWAEVEATIANSWDDSIAETDELPHPFMSLGPGGRVLFYWDAYFINRGLLIHQRHEIAKSTVDCLLWYVDELGFVPNANQAWGRNRSQPPFLAMMVRDVFEAMPSKDRAWLRTAYSTLTKEYEFWTTDRIENHVSPIGGLSRYSHHATETELADFYDQVLVPRFGLDPDLARSAKAKHASPWVAEAESGMDFTPRFEGRCPDFAPVDLNTNLFAYEKILSWMVNELGLSGEPDWSGRAQNRKELLSEHLWNEAEGLFLDYDANNRRYSSIPSSVAFFPLWAELATPEQAQRVASNLHRFEEEWGITVCESGERTRAGQWDHPVVWAPLQLIVVEGLQNYGFEEDALRIAMKYLDLVTKNFREPSPPFALINQQKVERPQGQLYEKYTAAGGIDETEYPANAMMGWTAGVWVLLHEVVQQPTGDARID